MNSLIPRSWSLPGKIPKASLPHSGQQYGIKTWYEPEHPAIDIVFIHGLKGDRDKTWTATGSVMPWPKALLPLNLPRARILTYGYDSRPIDTFSMVSSNCLQNHANNFLSALATNRSADEIKNRPIIFVAHSMGGLICQDMLVASRCSPEIHLQRIVESTAGVMFLGTPHSGSALALYAERLAKLIGAFKKTNPRIIGVLRRDSEVLARIQTQFHLMLKARQQDGEYPIAITCYYEELPFPGIGEVSNFYPTENILFDLSDHVQVVPQSSAVLHGYTSIGIHSHHKDMVRFRSASDPGFISVAGELERWASNLSTNSAKEIVLPSSIGLDRVCGLDHEGSCGTKIRIMGNVINSSVVNGTQVIYGDLTFRD
ncbi:hypothetical protein E8E14_014701 [Neopestalotiopsis sp. 37M]|nr:hypothetical protein E8E14_014701 [Neopestalotiopsis sp. 37M]